MSQPPTIPAELIKPRGDGRDWARAILAQLQRGEKRSPAVYRFAHETLGLPVPAGMRS